MVRLKSEKNKADICRPLRFFDGRKRRAALDVQHRNAFVFHHLQLQEHFTLPRARNAQAAHGDVDGAEVEPLEPHACRTGGHAPLRAAGVEDLEGFLVLRPQLEWRRAVAVRHRGDELFRIEAERRALAAEIVVQLVMDAMRDSEHEARGAPQFFAAAGYACSK